MPIPKIEKQKRKVAKLQERIVAACETVEFKSSWHRKHKTAVRKYNDLRTELEVERSILYRMEDNERIKQEEADLQRRWKET